MMMIIILIIIYTQKIDIAIFNVAVVHVKKKRAFDSLNRYKKKKIFSTTLLDYLYNFC